MSLVGEALLIFIVVIILVIFLVILILWALIVFFAKAGKVIGSIADNCNTNNDCESPLVCTNGRCYTSSNCQSNTDCANGYVCNMSDGRCVRPLLS